LAVENWDIWSHPALGTATYLSGGGAPFLTFSTCSRETGSSDSGSEEEEEETVGMTSVRAPPPPPPTPEIATPDRGWLCFPRTSRHVAFQGRMLHGVPEELLWLGGDGKVSKASRSIAEGKAGSYSRLSFLVNVWTSHRPVKVLRIPKRLAEQLRGASGLNPAHSLLALQRGQSPARPQRHKIPGARLNAPRRCRPQPSQKLYALKDHLHPDTGLLPTKAVVAARRASANRAATKKQRRAAPTTARGPAPGLLEMQYFLPSERSGKKASVSGRGAARKALRKRPAAAAAGQPRGGKRGKVARTS